jgi:REP element-mobilizing transposase RayT
MNRGDRREPIFKDDPDRECFLKTLGEACAKTGWQVHALCLMPNHFHLVVETPQPNLVAGMKWFLSTYTARFNRRHKLFGHLFSGRYKALIVDGSGNGYLKTVCDYVHLNPARARLLRPEQPLSAYRWGTWPEYLKSPGKRPAWLRVDRLLGEYQIPKDSAAGRRRLAECLEQRRSAEDGRAYQPIRRGWFLGNEALKRELLEQASGRMGENHYATERREGDEAKAQRIIAGEIQRLGWTRKDLANRPKGDPGKVAMAWRLRAETTMTLKWIASELWMGTWTYVSNLLSQRRHKRAVKCQ